MRNSTKRLTDQWAANLIQWRIRIGPIARKYFTALGNVAIGLLATLTSFAALYYPQLRETLNAQSVETILYQLGATFGTILALVLTLSIIPIQRAGEVWSPAILLLYRRDPSTYITFLVLGVLCVASFLFAIKGFGGISASVVLAVAVGVLGLTLDLLRWYHGHVCQLLEPARAVGLAIKYARQAIDRIQHLVARTAKLQHRMLSSEQRNEVSTEDVETTIYPRLLGHSNSIIFWINDLAEIAAKATLRGERFLARAAVNAIGEITKYYLSARKQNLILLPDPEAFFLASRSDVDLVVNKAYEALVEISRTSVANEDESTAIRVSEAFESIAVHTETLGARAFRSHAAPLPLLPLHTSCHA